MSELILEPEPFLAFPKIPRYSRNIIITEKIDGTNAQVYIPDGIPDKIIAGSRTRYITPGRQTDNYGFAAWVEANREELLKLGPGRHYGEWAGAGINRAYGLPEKRFFLFNTGRWGNFPDSMPRPACCEVVPVIYQGPHTESAIQDALERLRSGGSLINPDFKNPEGIVVFHTASRTMFKKTLVGDESPKSLSGE